jgi:hypothetical protein
MSDDADVRPKIPQTSPNLEYQQMQGIDNQHQELKENKLTFRRQQKQQ